MLRLSGRVRKILVAVLAGLVVIGAVALAILPEVVRRVAVDQVPKLTGHVLASSSSATGNARASADAAAEGRVELTTTN